MTTYTSKYRPYTYSEVIGQPSAVKLLKAVVKTPDRATNCIIIQGPWGTGKTTLARIFGRSLACTSYPKTGVVCGTCESCLNFDKINNRYKEYDSSMVGSVSQIKELRPVFELETPYYRVLVFDEAHLISRQAQGALLKTFEEGPKKTFFVLCSTEKDMILGTIHSRALVVDLYSVPDNDLRLHMQDIYAKEGNIKALPDSVQDKIVFKADGHVRDAVSLLDTYCINRDESLLDIPVDSIIKFFAYAVAGDKLTCAKVVKEEIMSYPLHLIQKALNSVILNMLATASLRTQTQYTPLVAKLGNKTTEIFRYVSEKNMQAVYNDKYLTAALFITLIDRING